MPPAASTSDRRRCLQAGLLAGVLLAGSVATGCGRAPPVVETLHVFGGETTLEIRGAEPAAAQAAIAESARHLAQLEREWHAWEDSDLTRINAAFARGETARAPPSILRLVERSRDLQRASDGWYDPGIGRLVELWGFHTSDYPITTPVPSRQQIAQWREARASVLAISLVGDQLASRNPSVALDFGAIAEGVAADQVVAILRKHGIRHALVSMGGDVMALGDGDGKAWQVVMRDPFGGVLGGVELVDGEGLFTSGNYNKFRAAPDGGRWGHVLNPRTGMPAEGTAAVAVLHPDPVLADIASTAMMAAGPSQFAPLARRMKLGCALLLTEENELLITSAMKARMRFQRTPVPLGEPLDLGPGCSGQTR